MDSITHIALGAVIGEAVAGKALGKRAMLIGAIAQSVPDIDFIQSFWLAPIDNLLAHRGFTHSFLFGIGISFIAAWAAARWISPGSLTRTKWFLFFALEIGVHLMLDSLNNYGIGWLEPFSHQRISFDVIFVADPFFSIWVGIGVVALWVMRTGASARKLWWRLSLAATVLYLFYALYNKSVIDDGMRKSFQKLGIVPTRMLTTPAPFNNWLWFYAAEANSGYYVGYRSVFDRDGSGTMPYFPRQDSLLERVKDQDALGNLIRFSRGFYTAESRHDTVVFNDLRFGQVAGWSDPKAPFAFHFYLNYPEANLMVVQRGRFENWNQKTIAALFRRIRGVPTPSDANKK